MHPSVHDYVAHCVERVGVGRRVLEVGSYDVNGGVRDLLPPDVEYVGLDARPGPGVDEVVELGVDELPGWAHSFTLVLCLEVLEHARRPAATVRDMAAALAPGGHLVLTTRGFGFGRHDHPADYWRFTPEAVGLLLDDAGLETVELGPDTDPDSPGVFALARR